MEKKRASDSSLESDRAFLDRTGVADQIKDVLSKIIENRPKDPVEFLANFFAGQGSQMDRVTKANQLLLTANYTKPAYHSNVRAAYNVMSFHKIKEGRKNRRSQLTTSLLFIKRKKRKQLKALTGINFMELINMLIEDFPLKVRNEVLKKLRCRDYEVIPFDIFQSTVFTCLVLRDFLQVAIELYRCLDPTNSDEVDKVLCETIHLQLYRAVSMDDDNPASMLDAGRLLGPEKIYANLATAMFNSKGTKHHMTCEDFLSGAVESFLSKVKRIE